MKQIFTPCVPKLELGNKFKKMGQPMQLHNIWFDMLSFLVAVLMAAYAVFSIVDYARDKTASPIGTIILVGVFAVLSILFFWMSLRSGELQRKLREQKRRDSRRDDLDL